MYVLHKGVWDTLNLRKYDSLEEVTILVRKLCSMKTDEQLTSLHAIQVLSFWHLTESE